MPSVIEDEYEEEIISEEDSVITESSEEIETESLVDELTPQLDMSNEENEDKDYTSIIDLISDSKDTNEIESDISKDNAPDLFSTTSETLNKDKRENSEGHSQETDDDYLEIPAFLRRQSK